MRVIEVEKQLADLAAGQWGLVTTPQATALGVTHSHLTRLAEQDVITRLSHGVYRLRSAPSDRHLDLRAAWLVLAPTLTAGQRLRNPSDGPIVSHASAASLHGWGDLSAYDSEFTFDGRKQTRRDGVRIHRGSTPKADVEIVNGLPATTAERLIVDLLTAEHDTDHIGAVLAGAIRDRSVDLEGLAERVAPYAMRRGFGRLAGDELVAALVGSGGAEDEAIADSLVRLAKVSDRRPPDDLANIWASAPAAMRIVAESREAKRMREAAAQALAGIDTNSLARDLREAHRILNDPATMQALANARKLM